MKKNVMSAAVAAAALSAVSAHGAMYLNHEGTGEVLMFPFYDAENGNATNIHIVNTTDAVKAVKVRFLEYKSSYEVLDFNLYLSAEDHFAFGVIMDPNGTGGAIITSDNSCTVPALGTTNNGYDGTTTENADGSVTRVQPFVPFEFQKRVPVGFVDQDVERTLRGHIEVIEMGEVLNNADKTTEAGKATQYASFATHDAAGMPANCAGLEGAWATGLWAEDADELMTAPTGGLYGLAYHINVEDAAAWGFEPAAIEDWWLTGSASDAVGSTAHAVPGSIEPNFNSSAQIEARYIEEGKTAAAPWAGSSAIDAVSATIMTQSIMNDVMLNPAIGGQTDWVVTFPTKRDYVTSGLNPADPADLPFTDPYDGAEQQKDGSYKEQRACEVITVLQWDREEAQTTPGNGFSPRPPDAQALSVCDEQSTTAWGPSGTASALNVERDLTNLSFGYTEGWSRWNFDANKNYLCDKDGNNCLLGLPLIGFGAYKYANGSSGGTLMNYGHAADHKTDVCTSGASSVRSACDLRKPLAG